MVLVLAPAYVHRSTGRPGIDPGTGWTGTARLAVGSGVIVARPAELPCELTTGSLRFGSREIANCVPVPFSEDGSVEFEAVTLFGERLAIQGRSLRLTLLGEAAFVESFPGSS